MWLTVLVALPEVLQVFYMDEMVTGMSHYLCWSQIHILRDPVEHWRKKKNKQTKNTHTFVSQTEADVCANTTNWLGALPAPHEKTWKIERLPKGKTIDGLPVLTVCNL